ncbi:Cell morphogenesis protein PAG1, partial [Cryomyces antarcticus]
IDDRTTDPDKGAIEDLIDSIRRHESKVVWSYDDNNGEADNDNDIRVPQAMSFLTEEVVKVFAHTHPSLREDWGKMTLTWATSCAVRHIACRSFQIFRCVLTTLDPQMLADMLARLSNTIADDNNDYLTFSMEILTTIKTIVEALEPVDLIKYPQLFWTTAACLDTIFEREFMESLSMLERLLDKLDLSDPAVIKLLIGSQPPKWEGMFEGLQSP